jgi:two-component system, OmpR family, phosphate regulon sensor histidine kinase PhoR
MARRNPLWKLYVIFTFVVIVAMTLGGFALQYQLQKSLLAHLEEDSFTLLEVLSRSLPETDNADQINAWCDQFAPAVNARITVLSKEGNVLGDSLERSLTGVVHLDRPEIVQAFSAGRATAIRFSETFGTELFYASLWMPEKNRVIRLSMPMTQVKDIENEVFAYIVMAMYLSPLFAIVLVFFLIRRLTTELICRGSQD